MKKILFVCTGNTCRSPMCAALFNHKFADQFSTSASSAGIFTDGAPINHKSVTALLEKGVISSNFNPYNDHISHSVTESDIIESDLVYGVTEQHSAHLKLMFPEHADKIFSLPIQISDPFGQDLYAYKSCLDDIDKALGILFEARQNNMYDITISFALLNDLQEILEIENDSFSSPWSEKSIFDAIRSKNIAVYVAKNNEKQILGFACLLTIGEEAELLNIAVKREFRRFGIADKLMMTMLDTCLSDKIESVYLEVRQSNIPAQKLYEKYGFKTIGIRKKYYSAPTEDALLMKLVLVHAVNSKD